LVLDMFDAEYLDAVVTAFEQIGEAAEAT